MTRWPDRRIVDLFGNQLSIIQAPMVGATTVESSWLRFTRRNLYRTQAEGGKEP